MNIFKILGGLFVLFFGLYVMYIGGENGNNLLIVGGVIISFIGAIVVFVFRYMESMNLLRKYKKAIQELKKDPDNPKLIENAYMHGKEFYRSKSGDGMLNSKLKRALDMDIEYSRGKLEE